MLYSQYYSFSERAFDIGKVTCFECDAVLENVSFYKEHLQIIHNMQQWRMFRCEFCPMKFVDPSNKLEHFILDHECTDDSELEMD